MTKEKNKIIMIIILILISLIALVGSSYALLTKSFKSKKLSMQVGTLKIDFAEGNAINMDNAAPMTDADGLKSTPYTFTITNSGDINAYYTVSNEEELANTLDTSYLRMRLTGSDGYDSGIKKVKDLGTETYKLIDDTLLETGKSVTYELRMWISQDAGNDIQDKVYKSKIVVNGASNKVPSATDEILAKANPKDLDYNTATDDQKKEMWTFSHEATEQTEALTDYRYIGKDPNNYVKFNDELWRIIGVFDVDDGTGKVEKRLKIIRNESIGSYSWDYTSTGTSTNEWSTAQLNTLLNSGAYYNRTTGTYYNQSTTASNVDFTTTGLTAEAKAMIGNTKWYLGGNSSEDTTASMLYTMERGTTVYSGRSTNWTGKVGLIYPSDYGYATSGGSTTDRTSCLATGLYDWDNSSVDDCKSNDWLFTGSHYWTIMPRSSNTDRVFHVSDTGYLGNNGVSNYISVRPIVHLKSTVKVLYGLGTKASPYILSEN
mgnify:CR=1 FL=1